MELIHKKNGRLHIYVRQDTYKGELKSKNYVGRIYLNGKQMVKSSGTTVLEEAIPILEKWFDEVHLEIKNNKGTVNEKEILTENPPVENKVSENISEEKNIIQNGSPSEQTSQNDIQNKVNTDPNIHPKKDEQEKTNQNLVEENISSDEKNKKITSLQGIQSSFMEKIKNIKFTGLSAN